MSQNREPTDSLFGTVDENEFAIWHVDKVTHGSRRGHVARLPASLDPGRVEHHAAAEFRGGNLGRDLPRIEIEVGSRPAAEEDFGRPVVRNLERQEGRSGRSRVRDGHSARERRESVLGVRFPIVEHRHLVCRDEELTIRQREEHGEQVRLERLAKRFSVGTLDTRR